ncbi:MAG: hypothetical protein PHX34_03150 [Candidatus Shapirobacteria bacterium]|nr:hypothetical protein [Candidatus Shapirobacteria bacterium]
MSENKPTKKIIKESPLPKFVKPNTPNLDLNKFRQTFKPTGRFQTINRSRR